MTVGFWTRLAVHLWGATATAGFAMLAWYTGGVSWLAFSLFLSAAAMMSITVAMDNA